ncbi:MAG: FimV/HubP family polar landmark protein [Gallionella sp.]
MRKSLLKLLFSVAALTASVAVHALGMGGINVTSALGRPLQADIEIVAATKAEQNGLEVSLAPSTAYRDSGLEYPRGIKFKFQLDKNTDGTPYLKVTSDRPINDPFVSLLIEVSWPSGRLLREYTFLLDPPGYVPAQAAIPEVQVVIPTRQAAPVAVVIPDIVEAPEAESVADEIFMPEESTLGESVSDTTGQTETIPEEESALPVESMDAGHESMDSAQESMSASTEPDDIEQSVPVEEEEFEEITEVIPEDEIDSILEGLPEPTVASIPPVKEVPETLEVQRGDTMFEIAAKYKQPDVSVERMLVALYRANVDKFDDENMNRIQAGKVIRMPDADELLNVTQADAKNEIRVQAKDWNAYRQKLASASQQSSQLQEIKQVAVGKINSSVIDQAPVAKKSAREVLKLSKGAAPGDQAGVGGKKMSAQDKKNAIQEDAIAKSKSSDEKSARAALLEKNLKDMERLAQLRAEAAALATIPSGAATKKVEVAANKVKVESAIQPPAKPEPKAAPKPTQKTKVKTKPAQPEPGLIDQIMEDPLYLAGGALILIGLGGLGVVMMRRRRESSFEHAESRYDEAGEETGRRLAVPVESSPETGDFTGSVESEAVPEATQDQTQTQDSDSVDPISEAELFLSFGRDVQAEEILKEALSTSPNNKQIHLKLLGIYSSRQDVGEFEAIATQLKDVADEDTWQQAAEMGLKLDPSNVLYGGSASMEDSGSATVQMAAADFSDTIVETAATEKPSVLDFDINSTESEGDTPTSLEENLLGDMDSTVVLDTPPDTLTQQDTSTQDTSGLDSSMDFDISSDSPSVSESPEAADTNFEDTVFDVTGGDTSSGDSSVSDIVLDIGDESMEFTLDEPVNKSSESAPVLNTEFLDIDLNLGEELAPESVSDETVSDETASNTKSDQWQEVATKLDLAKAYQEMGDADGAREILDEVLREGDAEQKQAAQSLLDQLD